MQPNDTPFLKDTLDEQLDSLADALAHGDEQARATPTAQVYRQLTQAYAAHAEQEAQAIARVGERLAAQVAAAPEPSAPERHPLRTRELPSAIVARALPPTRRPRRTRLSRRAAILRGVAAALVVVMVGAFALLRLSGANSPATNSYHWTIIPSKGTAQAVNGFTGITLRTATDGWAWGYTQDAPTSENSNPIPAPLVEHWNGKQWSIVPTPAMLYGGEITDIVSLAADDAWAVGSQLITPTWSQDTTGGAVIEHWDGKRWTMIPANVHTQFSTDDTSLTTLAALAPNDIWAVGAYSGATNVGVIAHWDGRQWREVTHPEPSGGAQFTSVAAIAPNDIWVAGASGGKLGSGIYEHWDGAQWRLVSAPAILFGGAKIQSLSGVSASDVWAVGRRLSFGGLFSSPLIEHWDGQSWQVVSSPAPQNASLATVVALGPDDVWAVGNQGVKEIDVEQQGQGLVEHWDGQQWSVVSSPSPQPYSALLGVAGDPATPGKVWVVGTAGPTESPDQPSNERALIEAGEP